MSESTHERSAREQQVDALILQFEQAADQGTPLNQADFLRQHPEFAAELREYFADVGCLCDFQLRSDPEPSATEPIFVATPRVLSPGAMVKYFGDYEILEELGHGGMGIVYKARQTKLKKIVALKMIKEGQLASQEEIRRFQSEARAAARLDHPGIVSVHEVGVDHRQHYYAMDYVAGGSLSQLYREQPVAARRAAEIVKKLAEAMHYAHGQNIVHRDLKPANVLLTTSGAPRITDFGLAKRLRTDGDSTGFTLTETGQVLGTAGYMSPEQAAGKTNLVGTHSDIYSLGAILYALLTSRAPFVGDSPSVTILQVLNQEPVPLRALNPSVPRDLETICLKCLEKEPHKRYGTAQLLADDLNRFLEGRAVAARPISGPARGWRWCRRNPVVATLTAAIALTLLIGITTSTTLAVIASQNADLAFQRAELLKSKNAELQQTNRQLGIARNTADGKRREAEQNATIAREQSQLALKSLESVIFDIQRKLDNVQGGGGLRRSLLQTALARLQEVSDRFASRAAIDLSTVAALNDLGDVFLRIGANTSSGSESVGPLEAARKAYQQALEIALQLAEKDPKNPRVQRDLAQCYGNVGDTKLQAGDVAAALQDFEPGLAIIEKLTAAEPENTQYVDDLCDWHARFGDLHLRSGNVEKALASYQQGLEASLKIAPADPQDSVARRQRAIWYAKFGDRYFQAGDAEKAIEAYREGQKISVELAKNDPSAAVQRELASLHGRLGHVLLESNRPEEALSECQEAVRWMESLAKADPHDIPDQRDLSRELIHLANVQLKLARTAEAEQSYQRGYVIIKRLADADPSDADAQRGLSICYERFGDLHANLGNRPQALEQYKKGLEISLKLAADNPSDPQSQLDPFTAYFRVATVHEDERQYEQAGEYYTHALKVLQTLATEQRLPLGQEVWIDRVKIQIVKCKYAPVALGDWESLLKQRASALPFLLDFRGQQFVKEGRFADACQAATKLRELKTALPPLLYNAACIYALSAANIGIKPDGLTTEQSAERQKLLEESLASLRAAIAAGYDDFAHLNEDPDLAPLHDLAEFRKLTPGKAIE